MSSLQALSGFKLEIHFVQNIIKDYTHLTNKFLSSLALFLDTTTFEVNMIETLRTRSFFDYN